MKVALVTTRPDKASFKFRVMQYIPYLQDSGINYEIFILPRNIFTRRFFFRRLNDFDIVFWQKRLLGRIDLWSLRKNSRRLLYDVDDSVMYNDTLDGNFYSRKRSKRFKQMVEGADQIVVGNEFLGEFAAMFTEAKKILKIPSVIDMNVWDMKYRKAGSKSKVIIGWVGSQSTLPYWIEKLSVWKTICQRFPQVVFRVVCDGVEEIFSSPEYNGMAFQAIEWNEAAQVENCATFDIGIMPLADNPWTRGKCGFKLIQYLSLGIPAIASPVGVNTDIILHDKTGLLAETEEEWIVCLKLLIENQEKRLMLGNKGHDHIMKHYSLQAWLGVFQGLFKMHNK
jgi:glycosyltransferase involved in cell wall biosynthesis